MAGFFIVFDSHESMVATMQSGVYSSLMKEGRSNAWFRTAEATLADYASMREGDALYFFSNRRVYGRGRLVRVHGSCRRQNYPRSSSLEPATYSEVSHKLYWDSGKGAWERRDDKTRRKTLYAQRWLCTFVPDPEFWLHGVDMDDLLDSNPDAFRVVRAMASKSFIKVDDQEEAAFLAALARANRDPSEALVEFDGTAHAAIEDAATHADYGLGIDSLLNSLADGESIKHEMAVEAALMAQIADHDEATVAALGTWHHVSRQVPASPHKPSRWMDYMDLFGYSYLPDYHGRVIGRFYVAEVKRGVATKDDVEQTMRYVDWVKDQYADNDYSLIRAYLIANAFPDSVRRHAERVGRRLFTVRRRPAETDTWQDLVLLRYRHQQDSGRLGLLREDGETECAT